MPRYNIWIRVDDNDIWQSIQDKPEWLHRKLQEEQNVPKESLGDNMPTSAELRKFVDDSADLVRLLELSELKRKGLL